MSSHNMSWVQYPSCVSTAVEDVIAAQSIISRCLHVYMALSVPISLVAGLFNLTTFIKGRARQGSLDAFLLDLTVTNMLVTLLSLTAISRPDYMATTNLSCAILCFLANVCYFNVQYAQLAMLSVFLLQGSLPCLRMAINGAQSSVASLAAIGGCAFCSSLVLVALLGTSGELVLFGESCVNSLAILFLHGPCRLALLKVPEQLTQRCRKEEPSNSFSLKRIEG